MLQHADGHDTVVEAAAAGRTAEGEIVLEETDENGSVSRLHTFRAGTVTAVFLRRPLDGGRHGWFPQPADGTWWCC
ncbi:hypothetical protein ACPCSF_24655 [Streptomyces griseoincarnatus]